MRLTDEQIREGLDRLPEWELDTRTPAIHRTVRTSDFAAAIALVNDIAQAAEQAQHHPDIDIRYDTVYLALSTHSEGAVTDKDVALAARVNELLS